MDEEFMNTLRNIGTKWYQCPNGHAYTIGECGLAMVESICPECGERIGGRDHQLLKPNKLVDFDLDVKNNINITPVKVINKKDKDSEQKEKEEKKDNINVDKKEKEEKNEKEENKEKKENKDNDKNEKEENKENKKNKDNDKNEKEENKENKDNDKINNLSEKEE